jgi:hypothetical protein
MTRGSRRRVAIRSALLASTAACWASKTTAKCSSEHFAGKQPRQPARGLAAVPARRLGWSTPSADAKAGVPEEVRIRHENADRAAAVAQALLAAGAPHHCVLADAGYGVDTAFRQALSDMGLLYVGGGHFCSRGLAARGQAAATLNPTAACGRPPVMPQAHRQTLQPMSVKALAQSLPSRAFQNISWRDGNQPNTQWPLRGRAGAPCRRQCRQGAAASRAMAAHRVACKRRRAEQVRPVHAARGNTDQRVGQRRPPALAHRARLPGSEAGLWPGALRGTRLAGVPPSCRAKHRGLWVPNGRTSRHRQVCRW